VRFGKQQGKQGKGQAIKRRELRARAQLSARANDAVFGSMIKRRSASLVHAFDALRALVLNPRAAGR
jgi:hypothetical protein